MFERTTKGRIKCPFMCCNKHQNSFKGSSFYMYSETMGYCPFSLRNCDDYIQLLELINKYGEKYVFDIMFEIS